jgi:hypothetical protein
LISCSRAWRSLSRISTSAWAPFQRFARRQARRRQFRLALERLSRHVELGLRALEADLRLLERRAGAGDRGDIAAYVGFGGDRIDLQQELTGAHAIAFLDGELRDAAHRLGADVHGLLGIDLARRRHDRLEVALLDRLHRHGSCLLTAARHRRCRAATRDHEDEHNPEPFLAKHRASC